MRSLVASLVTRSYRLAALAVVPALVLAACSNASTSGTTPGGQTAGVYSDHIDVGGIASETVPGLANQFTPIYAAVQAYFNQVNARGGVNGRKLNWVAGLDDQGNSSLDVTQAQSLVNNYHVFAVVGVAVINFTAGPFLGQNNIPAFGYEINAQWSPYPSLFGENGSYLNFLNHTAPALSWLAQTQVRTSKVGVFAYSVAQSAECAQGDVNEFNQYHLNVALNDSSLPFGFSDVSSDIQKLKSSGARFVTTCMDISGNKQISQGLQEAGLYNTVAQGWVNGGDSQSLQSYAPQMQGVYFQTADGNVPAVKGYTQGMDNYLNAMAAANLPVGDVTLAGWINADLFVKGLSGLGRNVTRQGLINAINKMTHYTANNILAGVNWTEQHAKDNTANNCVSFYQVQGSSFVPAFGHATPNGKVDPFVCWQAPRSNTINPVAFPYNETTFFDSTEPPPPIRQPVPPGS